MAKILKKISFIDNMIKIRVSYFLFDFFEL